MKVYVFIDESGDNGTRGRGTRWLVFGCVATRFVFSNAKLRVATSGLAKRINGGTVPLHFNKLGHKNKRGALKTWVETGGWQGMIVASDTTLVPKQAIVGQDVGIADAHKQYNYALKYVIERVSWMAAAVDDVAHICIEDRTGRFDLEDFKRYMRFMASPPPDQRVKWDHIDLEGMYSATRGEEPLLCMADGLANATFEALEPDEWGHLEERYLEMVEPLLWRGPKGIQLPNHGITFMPTRKYNDFCNEYPWIKEMANK